MPKRYHTDFDFVNLFKILVNFFSIPSWSSRIAALPRFESRRRRKPARGPLPQIVRDEPRRAPQADMRNAAGLIVRNVQFPEKPALRFLQKPRGLFDVPERVRHD